MATPKKRRGKKAASDDSLQDAVQMDDKTGVITIPEDPGEPDDDGISIDPSTGTVSIKNDDGSLTIDPTGASLWQKPAQDETSSHEENLALKIDPGELARISEELLTAIAADKQDRSQWEQMRAKCIELLGLKLEDPKGDVSRSALGMSTSVVRDPSMLQAVNMFRANTYSELCPSAGPVKVKVASPDESKTSQINAQELQDDLNAYLTTTASEYYPDMFYMLWWTGLASGTFKKVYKCPLRNRPVSEYVDGTKLIVSDSTDLKNAPRITHEVEMDRATMRAMQLAQVYRDIELTEPMQVQPGAVAQKRATQSGMSVLPQRIEDQKYTLYECYAKIDIRGFEHEVDGESTGLPLPYRVTIDDTSRQILEVRRNWPEEDNGKIFLTPQIPFVSFPFSTGLLRTYGTGLGHEMGNMASALTALLRISIDNGMLGNYPGVIKAKGPGRDLVNEIMIPPGGCMEVDTAGQPIQGFFMPLPYKDVSGNVMQLIQQTRGVAKELGGTANMPVSEGRQDAPVGTTLAMIEQALKPLAATHRMLCMAQAEEFRLFVKLFRDDPEALWRDNKRPNMGKTAEERLAKFTQALEDCDIEPVADPNVPSEMHRKLMALSLKQLTMGNPAYDQVSIDRWIARIVYKMPETDWNGFLLPPNTNPPPPDPRLITAQAAAQNAQTNQMKVALQAKTAQDQLQSKEQIEAAKLGQAHAAAMANGGTVEPDPLQAQALALKAQQVAQSGAKMHLDFINAHADRQSKAELKGLDIAARLATHPESQPEVNSEITALQPLVQGNDGNSVTPPSDAGPSDDGMKGGGFVPLTGMPPDHEAEAARAEKLRDLQDTKDTIEWAAAITKALQNFPRSGYMN